MFDRLMVGFCIFFRPCEFPLCFMFLEWFVNVSRVCYVFILGNNMSKSGNLMSTAYSPTSGLIADFESLFHHFELLKSVRYTHFIQVWKNFKMSCINAGRQTDQECREVSLSLDLKHYYFCFR